MDDCGRKLAADVTLHFGSAKSAEYLQCARNCARQNWSQIREIIVNNLEET